MGDWIAIVVLHQDHGRFVSVMTGGELDGTDSDRPHEFASVKEIAELKAKHIMRDADWFALNVETGESVEL